MSKELEAKQNTAIATSVGFAPQEDDFAHERPEDFAKPMLRILQPLSPEVMKGDRKYIKGASAGDVFNIATKEVLSGEEGIKVLVAHHWTRFVQWRPKSEGGGIVEIFMPNDPVVQNLEWKKMDSGDGNEKTITVTQDGRTVEETSYWGCLLLRPDGRAEQTVVPMKSTNMKHSKAWNSLQLSNKHISRQGIVYNMVSRAENNAKGQSYFVWSITKDRALDPKNEGDLEAYNNALFFKKALMNMSEMELAQQAAVEDDAPAGTVVDGDEEF